MWQIFLFLVIIAQSAAEAGECISEVPFQVGLESQLEELGRPLQTFKEKFSADSPPWQCIPPHNQDTEYKDMVCEKLLNVSIEIPILTDPKASLWLMKNKSGQIMGLILRTDQDDHLTYNVNIAVRDGAEYSYEPGVPMKLYGHDEVPLILFESKCEPEDFVNRICTRFELKFRTELKSNQTKSAQFEIRKKSERVDSLAIYTGRDEANTSVIRPIQQATVAVSLFPAGMSKAEFFGAGNQRLALITR